MSDSRTPDAGDALTAFPGLQLLGDDTALGVCADGVCQMPGAPTVAPAAPEKR